jgi:hypothetical protein
MDLRTDLYEGPQVWGEHDSDHGVFPGAAITSARPVDRATTGDAMRGAG